MQGHQQIRSRVLRHTAENESRIVKEAAAAIRRDGVVGYLSDTIYGLGCDPWSEKSLERLFAAKGRPPKKGVLLLIATEEMAKPLVESFPQMWSELSRELWPGPFTLLLPANRDLPRLVRGDENKVGLRVPDSNFLHSWMKEIPGPIVSTSANPSGHNAPRTFEEALYFFRGKIDLLIDSGAPPDRLPSTVIDLCTSPPKIVREGDQADRALELIDQHNSPPQ